MKNVSPDKHVLSSARFRAVGDLMVHQKQLDIALQPDGSYDFHPQFSAVTTLLRDADYTIANLETTIGMVDDLPYSGYPWFNTPESFLSAIRDAGVDFLTLANNNIMDRGYEGLRTTLDNVEAWGFDFGGVGRTPSEKDKPVVVEVGGIHVGFLCYTATMNKGNRFTTEEEALKWAEVNGIKTLQGADYHANVNKVKESGAEVVFALIHWGEEYRRQPEDGTIDEARKLITAGVDVILGSHPHMVQPVEFIDVETEKSEIRRGLVAYSLGNFISNQSDRYTDSGIVLDFTVCRLQGEKIFVKDVNIIPTYCWRREDMIQTLCTEKYLNKPPEGMSDATWLRLRESYDEGRGQTPL